jgi:two-component system, LytTR family, response regulator
MLRAVIIDDKESGIQALKMLLQNYSGFIRIVACAPEQEKGIALIEDYQPDIVFFDVSLLVASGFASLNTLNYRNFKLVFISAHRGYALEAIKHKAFDYLLTPIDNDDFKKCMHAIMEQHKSRSNIQPAPAYEAIELLVKDGIIYIRQEHIIRLEASRSYTIFYLDNGTKQVGSKNLKEYAALLDPGLFYRCHHSHVVNLKKVIKFINHDGFFAKMSDNSLAHISKRNKDVFLEKVKSNSAYSLPG